MCFESDECNYVVLCCPSATVGTCLFACVNKSLLRFQSDFPSMLSVVPLFFKKLPKNLRSHL